MRPNLGVLLSRQEDRPRARGRGAAQRQVDWTVRENARAEMRVIVKRILRKYRYPPDKQEAATKTVLEQAEVLNAEWSV